MPCTTQFDFNSSVGYTFDASKIEFTGGIARLIAGNEGTWVLITPDAAPALDPVYELQLTIMEVVGYFHRFLVSFDSGDHWETWGTQGWHRVNLSDIAEFGIGPDLIQQIREWPNPMPTFQVAIAMTRETGGGTGSIDNLTLCGGTNSPQPSDEPDGTDVLEPADPPDVDGHSYGSIPDWPLVFKRINPTHEITYASGYNARHALTDTERMAIEVQWNGRTEIEKDALVTFLLDHRTEAFIWTPPGEDDPKKFISTEPVVGFHKPNSHSIRAAFIEVLPL